MYYAAQKTLENALEIIWCNSFNNNNRTFKEG